MSTFMYNKIVELANAKAMRLQQVANGYQLSRKGMKPFHFVLAVTAIEFIKNA